MKRRLRGRQTAAALVSILVAVNALGSQITPADLYGELYQAVEMQAVFADSKTFADSVAIDTPESILVDYRSQQPKSREELSAFVMRHFTVPIDALLDVSRAENSTQLAQHIADLWPQLIRPATAPQGNSSLLAFPFPYVVPGGRFREIYYWDSYFTMLGLIADGHGDVARGMVDGFADLINRYGHVPNGTRSYYLSRSQPPFFYLMAGLLSTQHPERSYARYLTALRREHAYWMSGETALKPGKADRNLVRLPDGSLLNRYWDERDTPRDESYREDVLLATNSGREPKELYREIRAAAESGWDFSSRWFADGQSLATIETTAILPVDLNALLYGLEIAISKGCREQKDIACVTEFTRRAQRRKSVTDRYLWNAKSGSYLDYQWKRQTPTQRLSAATLYPLFVGLASEQQARAVAMTTQRRLIAKGGLATTTAQTGQQWDAPNGWAPLQWIAVTGLQRYSQRKLADEISDRWLRTVSMAYSAQNKLVEKYDVNSQLPGGGGEYPLQDGFGWTNGVTRALLGVQQKQNRLTR